MKLFCLAHAGGSAPRLARAVGSRIRGVETVPLELAGRGTRWQEPGYAGWPDATRDLCERVAERLDGRPYGLLGHSVGALLAYELAQRMREIGAVRPEILVVAARNPPHLPPEVPPRVTDLSDEDLFATLVSLGGVSPRAAGPLTYRTFLPALRSDLRLAHHYAPRIDRQPLDTPLLVLYGKQDQLTSGVLMPQWGRYTAAGFEVRAFHGDHFFVLSNASDVAPIIGQRCLRPADRWDPRDFPLTG
jgi:medium-chain acyl-[acyl-carrier-protein] hydrolase